MARLATREGFLLVLAATLLFRLWLSAALPVTADEAYFVSGVATRTWATTTIRR